MSKRCFVSDRIFEKVSEVLRFILNGLVATGVHYAVLTLNVQYLRVPSFGLSNLLAAVFGIGSSFLGNRFFVFRGTRKAFVTQLSQFSALYAVLAVFQGSFLFFWSDILRFDYRAGFLCATFLQFCVSYIVNKKRIFRHETT